MGCTGNEWVNMLLGKNRDISMVAIFQIRLRSFFLTSEKKDNAVRLRQYFEIFYKRFVQGGCF